MKPEEQMYSRGNFPPDTMAEKPQAESALTSLRIGPASAPAIPPTQTSPWYISCKSQRLDISPTNTAADAVAGEERLAHNPEAATTPTGSRQFPRAPAAQEGRRSWVRSEVHCAPEFCACSKHLE